MCPGESYQRRAARRTKNRPPPMPDASIGYRDMTTRPQVEGRWIIGSLIILALLWLSPVIASLLKTI